MWQAPSAKNRATANAKRRDVEKWRPRLHIKRVVAELKLSARANIGASTGVVSARVVLNDFSATGVGLFATEPVLVGTEVSLTIEHPKRFYCRARIVWCQEQITEGHILSQTPYTYRMGLQFVFESEEEETAVRQYYEELFSEHVFERPARYAA